MGGGGGGGGGFLGGGGGGGGFLDVGFLGGGFLLVGLDGLTGLFEVVLHSGGAPFASAGENIFGKPAMIERPTMPEAPLRILRLLTLFITTQRPSVRREYCA